MEREGRSARFSAFQLKVLQEVVAPPMPTVCIALVHMTKKLAGHDLGSVELSADYVYVIFKKQ